MLKRNFKKLAAAVAAAAMVMGLAMPAMASGDAPVVSNATQVQITKNFKIGQGITVPTETFQFVFANATQAEVDEIGDANGYIDPTATQQGTNYPDLNTAFGTKAVVSYDQNKRTSSSTDTELTFMTEVLDLTKVTWPAPGLYIYSVKETAGTNAKITYDDQTYFLKVYVKNTGTGNAVEQVTVIGWDETEEKWVKADAAPNSYPEPGNSDEDDGCNDLAGNEFAFTNSYSSLVSKHPINDSDVSGDTPITGDEDYSEWAFKLSNEVAGSYGNTNSAFDYKVTVILPDTFDDPDFELKAVVNGYTANQYDPSVDPDGEMHEIDFPNDGAEHTIYLKHGDSFGIPELPEGTIIHVEELARTGEKYLPTYEGKWGLDVDDDDVKTGTGAKGGSLKASNIVVGENGAYVQFTNTLQDSDVTPTGIIISNLPYILMVLIAAAGSGLFMVSKRRSFR